MTIEVTTKKWGNSMAVVLPREFVIKENLKENQKINFCLVKTADISDIFGMIKKRKMSGQKMKDLSKEEWER